MDAAKLPGDVNDETERIGLMLRAVPWGKMELPCRWYCWAQFRREECACVTPAHGADAKRRTRQACFPRQ